MKWPGRGGPTPHGAPSGPASPDSAREPGTLRTLGVDAALAVAILAILAVLSVAAGRVGPSVNRAEGGLGWVVLLIVAGVVPVALRRVAPLTSVVGVCAVLLVAERRPAVLGVGVLALLVVVYTRAALGPLRQAVAATVALAAAGAAVGLAGPEPAGPWAANVTAGVLAMLTCFFLGRAVFTRRAYTAALEERATEAELNREVAAREAVLDERRRIARELHDMVAHHVAVMGVLATGARRALRSDPDAADEALRAIEETGRASLREMRRMLDVLRADDERRLEEPPPEPGVGGLEHLVEQVREAGLAVEFTLAGPARALEPGVDLTVFRVVQEALTNVLKHAGAGHARVGLDFGADGVRVTVTDDGHGPTPDLPTAGHGLVGMRERVALYGGTLQTGARGGGGFRVVAQIPFDTMVRGPGERA